MMRRHGGGMERASEGRREGGCGRGLDKKIDVVGCDTHLGGVQAVLPGRAAGRPRATSVLHCHHVYQNH
ncbi:unnamed protein product, partial [Brenthis ino]